MKKKRVMEPTLLWVWKRDYTLRLQVFGISPLAHFPKTWRRAVYLILIRMFFAPKGHYTLAQGNALGSHRPPIQALKGRHITGCSFISDISIEKQYACE